MPVQRLAEEALGRRQVSTLAEPEFDRVADAVDGAIKIHPLAADLDVGLVEMPLAGHRTLAPVETPQQQQQQREANGPSMDGGVVDRNAPLGHHLLKITQAQIVGQVPAHTKQDQTGRTDAP